MIPECSIFYSSLTISMIKLDKFWTSSKFFSANSTNFILIKRVRSCCCSDIPSQWFEYSWWVLQFLSFWSFSLSNLASTEIQAVWRRSRNFTEAKNYSFSFCPSFIRKFLKVTCIDFPEPVESKKVDVLTENTFLRRILNCK